MLPTGPTTMSTSHRAGGLTQSHTRPSIQRCGLHRARGRQSSIVNAVSPTQPSARNAQTSLRGSLVNGRGSTAGTAPAHHSQASLNSGTPSRHGLQTNPSVSSNNSSNSSRGDVHLGKALCSCAAAVALVASSWVGPADWLLGPAPALAKARMTPDEQVTIDIFKKSTPSVVNVTNLATRRDAFTMNMLEIPQGAGSGFVWDKEGRVVTNYHVITDASDLQVTFSGGTEFSARVLGVDQDKDIAVLEVRATEDPTAADGPGQVPSSPTARRSPASFTPLGLCSSSSDLLVGQRVYAIGNPFGLDHTLTTGVVSGTGREIQSISGRPIQDVIQTDAAINPGNSGGPLLDSGGCLIGINTAIYSPSGANSGVGFAIPVDTVRTSVEQIIQHGKVVRPILGISFAPDQSSEQLGVKGILVLSSREGGPAWKAGIRGTSRDDYGRLVLGDIIVGINGKNVRNSSDLYKLLDKCNVGEALDIEVLRGDAKQHVTATLEANA